MPRTIFQSALLVAVLAVVLSACQIDVRYTTTLDGKGGGTFSLGVTMDKEARARAATFQNFNLNDINALFDGLAAKGWTVARTQPNSGLSVTASRRFADPAGFGRVLDDLRTTKVGGASGFDVAIFRQDYATTRSFFKTSSTFTGSFRTATKDPELRNALLALQGFLRIEVRAQLPGAVTVRDGSGTAEDGEVVWRPVLGTDQTFSIQSSALRIGSVLALALPLLALLVALGWFVLGRRRRPLETIAIVPDEVPVVVEPVAAGNGQTITIDLEPEPLERLLAIERDPVEEVLVIDREGAEQVLAVERDADAS
jgi:hypothetical protein